MASIANVNNESRNQGKGGEPGAASLMLGGGADKGVADKGSSVKGSAVIVKHTRIVNTEAI